MIREATHDDIPALLLLGKRMHAESPRFSRLTFSPEKLSSTLAYLVTSVDGFLWVAEALEVYGGMAAMISEHWCSTDRIATDLALFMTPEHRGSIAPLRLLNEYKRWAWKRGAHIVQVGITTGVETEKTALLYERLGLTRSGLIFDA